MASSFCRSAISVSALTLASLAVLSASACTIFTSRSALALAIAASFLIFDVLSIPRSRISPFSSVTFWMLQDRISMPSFFMSMAALFNTWSEKESLSVLMSFSVSVPTISRILPSKESCSSLAISSGFLFRKFFAARRMPSGVRSTCTLATASTDTLIKSLVGTGWPVLISTLICPRYRLSIRSKNGMRIPPCPFKIRGSFVQPEIISATFGGAFTYV